MKSLVCTALLITALAVECRILYEQQQEPSTTSSPLSPVILDMQTPPSILDSQQSKDTEDLAEKADVGQQNPSPFSSPPPLPLILDMQTPPVILDSKKYHDSKEVAEEADVGTADGVHEVDDMMLTEEQWSALRQRKAVKGTTLRWSEGPMAADGNHYPLVPYVFQNHEPSICKSLSEEVCDLYYKDYCRELCKTGFKAFPDSYRPTVENAIQHWKEHTCIDFVDITSEPESSEQRQKPHLLFAGFRDRIKCNSWIGMVNYRHPGQVVNTVGCGIGATIHEIGHAIGFFHEQSRSDRDDYVIILEDNIIPKAKHNFYRDNDDNYGIPYDYSSIMHYGATYFSKDGQPTILTKSPLDLELIGKRHRLTHRDKLVANRMYNCTGKWLTACSMPSDPCLNDGYTGKNCTCICPPGVTGSNCEVVVGDYYDEARDESSEEITTAKRVILKTPIEASNSILKSIVPSKCKKAKVSFVSSNMHPDCTLQNLHVATNSTDAIGQTLCAKDVRNGVTLTSETGLFITTINDIRYSSRQILWEAEVTFDDIPGCETVNSTTPTTTTTTTTTTTAATTTTTINLESKSCSSIFQFGPRWTNPWTNIRTVRGKMEITFPKTVTSWNLGLNFDQRFTEVIIWNMESVKSSATTVYLSPKPWNTNQLAGSVLTAYFHLKFSGSNTPKPVSAILNGDELCQGF